MERHWWRVIAGLLVILVGVVLLLEQLNLIRPDERFLDTVALFVGAGIFMALWFSNTKQWWPLIPGLIMLSWAVSNLLAMLNVPEALTNLIGTLGSALPFLYVFALNRKANWWALIPGGIFSLVAVATIVGSLVGEAWEEFIILLGIALAFFAVFVANRRHWWALIPAGILALIAISASPIAAFLTVVGPALVIAAGVILVLYSFLRPSR
jgi:hypothetical protein